MISEYEKLCECKSLGFYNSCEMYSAFIIDKINNCTYNFFTIIVFDEKIEPFCLDEYLTDKLIRISERFSMGVLHKVVSTDYAKNIFYSLCESENKLDIGNGQIQIGKLEFIPKVFIQQDGTKEILLNKVLKNNFRNGSYILEFFDVDKPHKILLKEELNKSTKILYNIIPIDLFTVSDRIGNFVFQFPSLNINVGYNSDINEMVLNYKILFDHRLNNEGQYQLISELIDDDNMVGFGSAICEIPESNIQLYVGDSSPMCCTTVIDNQAQLLLARQENTLIRTLSLKSHIGTEYGEQRQILNDKNEILANIDIFSSQEISIGKRNGFLRKGIIQSRQYDKQIEDLTKAKEFINYGIRSERKKALNDIRYIINLADSGKAYIWDPYLCANDLLETWYYNQTYGLDLHAITSKNASGKKDIRKWMIEQANILETHSNNYGIKMEYRCQHGNYGYAFHDRFLMILPKNEKPKVWSLGTSLNSIGMKHHIIQEVSHPQMIIDAFNELWGMLSIDECLIWKK